MAAIAAVIPTVASDLLVSDVVAGKIIAYYMIPYGISALFYASLAKTISVRVLMTATMFFFALTNILCGMVTDIGNFFFFRVLMGIVSAGVVPLGLILIGRIFEKEIRGRMIGLFFSCSFIASIVGIILSGVANWRLLFYVPAALGVVNAALLVFFRHPLMSCFEGRVDYLAIFRDVKVRNIFIFITVISTLYHGVDRWLGVYMNQVYHLNQLTVSLLFGLMAISSAAGQNLGGWISDKKGRVISCKIGLFVLAAGTMILSLKFNVAMLAILLVFLSLGWTVGHNGASTVLTDFPDDKRAEIASLNSALRFIGGGVGFTVSGLFIEKSFALTFLAIGVLLFGLFLVLDKFIPETITAKDAKG